MIFSAVPHTICAGCLQAYCLFQKREGRDIIYSAVFPERKGEASVPPLFVVHLPKLSRFSHSGFDVSRYIPQIRGKCFPWHSFARRKVCRQYLENPQKSAVQAHSQCAVSQKQSGRSIDASFAGMFLESTDSIQCTN